MCSAFDSASGGCVMLDPNDAAGRCAVAGIPREKFQALAESVDPHHKWLAGLAWIMRAQPHHRGAARRPPIRSPR
jgi:hypothetical protein